MCLYVGGCLVGLSFVVLFFVVVLVDAFFLICGWRCWLRMGVI